MFILLGCDTLEKHKKENDEIGFEMFSNLIEGKVIWLE